MNEMSPNNGRRVTPLIIEQGARSPAEASQDEGLISIGSLFGTLWRRLWIVLLVPLVLTGVVVGVALSQPPQYQASIKVLIGQEQKISQIPSDVMGLQQITVTMAEIAQTRPIAEAAIQELEMEGTTTDAFLANMQVEQLEETTLLQISYTNSDPDKARLIANTIGDVFSERVADVSPSANSITATTLESAITPQAPVSPNPVQSGLTALVVGLMLGAGLALLLEHLDDRWRSPEEAEQVSGVPTLGVVRQFKMPKEA